MKYATVCSGIEAPSAAWSQLGWSPVWFSETSPFPAAVLKHHYPDTPNLGDMTRINGHDDRGTIDLIFGGTPCQSFSILGERKGLNSNGGRLAMHFARLVGEITPRWVLWENVPGVFSTNQGWDFAAFLHGLAKRGYCLAWRVLDAASFGVPQRRRRVFVVGYLGDWRYPAAVLFDQESMRGNPKKGKAQKPKDSYNHQTAFRGNSLPAKPLVGTLLKNHQHGYSITMAEGGYIVPSWRDGCYRPRKITELECERLMGFPDHYTRIIHRGKPASYFLRVGALGNAVAVPVLRWIGERINQVEKQANETHYKNESHTVTEKL